MRKKNITYDEFLKKFELKKTTDDCYTPPKVYEAVKNWAVEKYNLHNYEVVRPFYPGGDYLAEQYSDNCVVIDNPPFSILTKIIKFYQEKGIKYFLFAPNNTLFSSKIGNYIISGRDMIFENGARIAIGFVTNLGEYKIEVCPDLYTKIEEACRGEKKKRRKYKYPAEVCTAARLASLAAKGVSWKCRKEDVHFVKCLDDGTGLYGGGFFLSKKAAAEKAAAEKAVVEVGKLTELSDREKEIIKTLG